MRQSLRSSPLSSFRTPRLANFSSWAFVGWATRSVPIKKMRIGSTDEMRNLRDLCIVSPTVNPYECCLILKQARWSEDAKCVFIGHRVQGASFLVGLAGEGAARAFWKFDGVFGASFFAVNFER